MAVSSEQRRWDTAAIRTGAGIALALAVPLWVGASWASERESLGLASLLSLGSLVAFGLGATVAAWRQTLRLPLAHALVTSVGTYIAVQVVVSIYRVAAGTTVNLFTIMFFVTLAAMAGLVGGVIGARLRRVGIVPAAERRADADRLRDLGEPGGHP